MEVHHVSVIEDAKTNFPQCLVYTNIGRHLTVEACLLSHCDLVFVHESLEKIKEFDAMSASVTLRQEKQVVTEDDGDTAYALTSWITFANPDSLYPLFVVTAGIDPEDEYWERVATLDDLVLYTENRLIRFYADIAAYFNTIGTQVGDKFIIDTPPAGWINTNFTDAKFTVVTVDPSGHYIEVAATKPFPSAAADLPWTMKNSAETVVRGTGTGTAQREDTGVDTFLRRHWFERFNNVEKAFDRAGSNESFVKAVVDSANARGTEFEGVDTETYE
jgi:hypothetical protein